MAKDKVLSKKDLEKIKKLQDTIKTSRKAIKLATKPVVNRIDYILEKIASVFYCTYSPYWSMESSFYDYNDFYDPDYHDSDEKNHVCIKEIESKNKELFVNGDYSYKGNKGNNYPDICILDKNNKTCWLDEGFPKRWLYENFESELIVGKRKYKTKLNIEKTKEQEALNKKHVEIPKIKSKLSPKEWKAIESYFGVQ